MNRVRDCKIIHKMLTTGEPGAERPGQLRTSVARSSTALLIYPTHQDDLKGKIGALNALSATLVTICNLVLQVQHA